MPFMVAIFLLVAAPVHHRNGTTLFEGEPHEAVSAEELTDENGDPYGSRYAGAR